MHEPNEIHAPEPLSLDNLAGGAVGELVARELKRIGANIADPNTDAGAKRELVVKIGLKPNKDRSVADANISVTSKLAPTDSVDTTIYISQTGNQVKLYPRNIRQQELQLAEAEGRAQ